MTLQEMKDTLAREEECSLLEMLDITSEEIAERFVDKIEDKWDQLEEEFEIEEEDD